MNRNPDVQRLLANLRSGGLLDNAQAQAQAQAQASSPPHRDGLEAYSRILPSSASSLETPPSEPTSVRIPHAAAAHHGPTTPQARMVQTEVQQQQRGSPGVTPSATPDPSSIITWPSAVKFVAKYIAPNAKLEGRIKHLISEQHKHEREWWEKREIIIRRHTGRADNQQRAADLLRSLGGQYVAVAPNDPQVDSAELEAYDMKVHKSLTQLAAHCDREMRQMGIPFFAIKHSLVVLDVGKEAPGATIKGRLDRGELRELQRRMAVHLEELFGDENETP